MGVQIIQAVRWSPAANAVRIIDQRRLPGEFVERDLRTLDDVCDAIRTLAVRGAPAIGVAAAMGLVASLLAHADDDPAAFARTLAMHAESIGGTRPTAVNLPWAMSRMLERAERARAGGADPAAIVEALRGEATAIYEEDRRMCQAIGEHGLPLLADGARVLTHCNAGALATAGIGTALAPVYLAAQAGRRVAVFADETRPLLQGSRLTAWELQRAGVPVTVLADNMAASLMRRGGVDLCIVGADRIAANGDGIVIEQRDGAEVVHGMAGASAPDGVAVYNPAFDVTPAELVTAIITDRGVVYPPYRFGVSGER